MAESTGAFGKLLSILRSQRNYVPSTLTFPQLDVPAEAAALKLAERAEQNARENRPATKATVLGDVESEIAARVQEVYAQSLDIYHQGLETYDRRIHANSPLETLSVEIKGTGRDAVAEYRLLAHKAQEDINFDRKNLEEVEEEFRRIKELHKLVRGARYPVGHRIHIGVILVVLFLDMIVNGYLLGVRDEFGLLGGVLQALLVAFLNVALGIIAGRVAIPHLMHRFIGHKTGGLIVLVVAIVLACALNLSFAHYRDLFSIGIPNPGEQALSELQAAPLTLRDIKSWWLAAVGMLFAFVALVDGYKWDDPYPGYGELSRRRDEHRREYLDRKHAWLEQIGGKREEARRDVGELRRDIEMMYADILQAATGRQDSSRASSRIKSTWKPRATSSCAYTVTPTETRGARRRPGISIYSGSSKLSPPRPPPLSIRTISPSGSSVSMTRLPTRWIVFTRCTMKPWRASCVWTFRYRPTSRTRPACGLSDDH